MVSVGLNLVKNWHNSGPESDEEIRRVPEIGGESAGTSASRPDAGSNAGTERAQGTGDSQKKRGRSPADKESKRLKRYIYILGPIWHLLKPFFPVIDY